ncbi:hypothetical protein EV651_11146 [Kribbella sp. VKM Ac-2571]|uniref:hypothetical protein n=1 Tax=Kribbella sp. VKM Ac-2571 TaxID=2512222 RepID=UPI00105D5ADF|nr:hypothetical protein [Kribbella sp. VKM Ac-2571]TDO57322.1 hypothetical protein EV651_11146 [Kribbella sp. VKM Ac-2571]
MTAVFPVGHRAGPHVVRVGRTAEHLSESEFGVWTLAHRSSTATELVTECLEAEIDDAEHHFDKLLDRGVLTRADEPIQFAQRHRLLPLFVGLGNRPDDLERFAIGVPGLEPLATVSTATYELWQWGWVAPSLWAHCEVLATIREQTAGEPGTPGAQLDLVLDGLSALLSKFVAVLEPVS